MKAVGDDGPERRRVFLRRVYPPGANTVTGVGSGNDYADRLTESLLTMGFVVVAMWILLR